MFDAYKNLAVGNVATAPSPAASGTSLTMTTGDADRFPAVPFNATIGPANTILTPDNSEIVRVTNIAGEVFTIDREEEGSAARTIVAGDVVIAGITQKLVDEVKTLKFTTFIVDQNGNGDYTTLQDALDAATGGAGFLIKLLPGQTHTVTSGLLYKGSNVIIEGNGMDSVIQADGSVVATLLSANANTYSKLGLRKVQLVQTNATEQGVAIDFSDVALAIVDEVYVLDWGTGLKLDDDNNNTFYNVFRDLQIFNCNTGIDMTSTNPVNDNLFQSIRIACLANGTALKITNGQNNVFINYNAEPASSTGTTGILLDGANVLDTTFIGAWVEGNALGLDINSGTLRTTFIGSTITSNTANEDVDTASVTYVGTRIGDTLRNQIPGQTIVLDNATTMNGIDITIDSSVASNIGLIIKNANNFAHAGDLADLWLKNASDSGKVLRIRNAGTGRSLSIEDGSGNAKFTVTQAGKVDAGAAITAKQVTLSDGATPALDASLGNQFRLSAGGNRTIAVPSNPTEGQKITIVHFASGAARTLALNTGAGGFRFGTDITGLTETGSGLTDYIGAIYNSTDSKWDVVSYVKGF